MATNWQQRLDDLAGRRESKAKAKAKARAGPKARAKAPRNQLAPAESELGSFGNPIDLDREDADADDRLREAEALGRSHQLARQGPELASLAPPLHPWAVPNRRGNAPVGAQRGLGPPPLRRGIGPRELPGPGAMVIDLDDDDDDAPVHSGDHARRESRFGFPGGRGEVIDLEAEENPLGLGNRGGRKVRFAPPGPVKQVIDLEARVGAKKGIFKPSHPIGIPIRRALAPNDWMGNVFSGMPRPARDSAPPLPSTAGSAKKVIDVDAWEGPSRPRPSVGDADPEVARMAQERARQLERAILGDPGEGPREGRRGVQVHPKEPIPPRFERNLRNKRFAAMNGFSEAVSDYYQNEMTRRDSRNVAGRHGHPSLVEEVLHENAMERLRGGTGPGWRPVRQLGRGGQGGVTLWEMNRPDGSVLQLATKDMGFERLFFRDYNAEGNITRRLNDIGCENVLRVLEWAVLEKPKPRFRIAYEVAEHGDLDHLLLWYLQHRLILPEPFIWHMWHSLANALVYQALGHNSSADPLPEWEEIVHGDIKPANILLCAPPPSAPSTPHAHYPTLKLADYGCAFTVPLNRPDVRAFKSTYYYGTFGYRAPEVKAPRVKRRDDDEDEEDDDDAADALPYDQHGAHTDVYSLGRTVQQMLVPATVRYRDVRGTGREVFAPYSARLTKLTEACMRKDGRARPSSYDLFVETGREVRRGREAFEAAVRRAERAGADHGVYQGKVLFGKEEQRRYETDMAYRDAYTKANLKWIFEQRPPPPPPGDGEG